AQDLPSRPGRFPALPVRRRTRRIRQDGEPFMPARLLGVVAVLVAGVLLVGCQKDSPPAPVAQADPQNTSTPVNGKALINGLGQAGDRAGPPSTGQPLAAPPPAPPAPLPALPATDVGQQEKYDDALLDALNLVADSNFADALAALEAARAIQDTE